MVPDDGTITELLHRAAGGDGAARSELAARVYDELRVLARAQLGRRGPEPSLQPTVLVHEAFLKLFGAASPAFEDRKHFFVATAQAMRRILVDHARERLAARRGAGTRPLDLARLDVAATAPADEILALHEAVGRLDDVRRQIVELRFFAGLTVAETAEALGLPARTVEREWASVRLWLHRELSAPPREQGS